MLDQTMIPHGPMCRGLCPQRGRIAAWPTISIHRDCPGFLQGHRPCVLDHQRFAEVPLHVGVACLMLRSLWMELYLALPLPFLLQGCQGVLALRLETVQQSHRLLEKTL